MKFASVKTVVAIFFSLLLSISTSGYAADAPADVVRKAVDEAVRPMMAKEHIAGMAVGITVAGKSWVFNYGVASTETHQPVTDATLFEVGSISKTFTATLTSWAQVDGRLSLSDKVEKFLPSLRNTPFGGVSLLNLGTHTPGGLAVAGARRHPQRRAAHAVLQGVAPNLRAGDVSHLFQSVPGYSLLRSFGTKPGVRRPGCLGPRVGELVETGPQGRDNL